MKAEDNHAHEQEYLDEEESDIEDCALVDLLHDLRVESSVFFLLFLIQSRVLVDLLERVELRVRLRLAERDHQEADNHVHQQLALAALLRQLDMIQRVVLRQVVLVTSTEYVSSRMYSDNARFVIEGAVPHPPGELAALHCWLP